METTRLIKGTPVFPGLVKAKLQLYRKTDVQNLPSLNIPPEKAGLELETASRRVKNDIDRLYRHALELGQTETAEILDSQLFILNDPELHASIENLVRDGMPLQSAIKHAIDHFVSVIGGSGNEYLNERLVDITDVGDRLLRAVARSEQDFDVAGRIVVSDELSPAEIVDFAQLGASGFVMQRGGPSAHASIIARAFAIPCIVHAEQVCQYVKTGDTGMLDSVAGTLVVNPDSEAGSRFENELQLFKSREKQMESLAGRLCFMSCGTQIHLQANIEFEEELPAMKRFPVDGIGLLRTEMLYLFTDGFSDMDRQVRFYVKAGKAAKSTVTIRLLDVGGDKLPDNPHEELNPYLGWRGVRILLDRPVLLENQLEAIIRAAGQNAASYRILIPMVSDLGELLQIKKLVHEVAGKLALQGINAKKPIQIGVMIETPSAALMAYEMAKNCDFLSIGTNDLTQYTLAVDRGNSKVGALYDSLHPSILRQIALSAGQQRNGVRVSVCGEAASDPFSAIVFAGLGVRELSMAPHATRDVFLALSRISASDASDIAVKLMDCSSQAEARRLKAEYLRTLRIASFAG